MGDPYTEHQIRHVIIKKFPLPGKEPAFYAAYQDLIRELPRKEMTDITAIVNTPEIAGASHIIQGVENVASKGPVLERRWIYGGIKVAHVHVDDKILLFNDEQWAAFSTAVRKRMANRIAKARSISMGQLQMFESGIDSISQFG